LQKGLAVEPALFAQKFSKPKPIIDELSAWNWKAPPSA
jgi:CRISPR/Cas system-associated exonuclease Cas4 (RecB family)